MRDPRPGDFYVRRAESGRTSRRRVTATDPTHVEWTDCNNGQPHRTTRENWRRFAKDADYLGNQPEPASES